eukprot:maker-scaffold207_size258870-snap-gene-1.17 protein:Tk01452 transcript:maker-scaffold207_size258870-snap-gene-1.17-mRNA-1 annotation:"PREDICTED: nesprin-1-like"
MTSKSPGNGSTGGGNPSDQEEEKKKGSIGRSFFAKLRRRNSSKDRKSLGSASSSLHQSPSASPAPDIRLERAYFGKRSDPRDRSSEDPRRHTIPRAHLGGSPIPPKGDRSDSEEDAWDASFEKTKRKSTERVLGRRASRERALEREKRRERSRSREGRGSSPGSSQRQVSATSVETQRQVLHTSDGTKFKVEQHMQLSQTSYQETTVTSTSSRRVMSDESKLPPIPPPRSRSKHHYEVIQGASDEPDGMRTSTPKKSPYQFWKEHQSKEEKGEDGSVRRTFMESTGAVVKESRVIKRERTTSGTSQRSTTSSTAEPLSKVSVSSIPSPQQAERVYLKDDDESGHGSKGGRKDRKSLSAMFSSLTSKKKTDKVAPEEERKTSIASLIGASSMLNPDLHAQVLQTDPEDRPSSRGGGGEEKEPILGTVLHPKPPQPPRPNARTPFQEWRHYRQVSQSKEGISPVSLNPEPRRISAPAHSPSLIRPTGVIRTHTPDPDYDNVSMVSTGSRSSYGLRQGSDTSHEDLHRLVGPQYYADRQRSLSSMGIPRYQHRPRTPSSLLSASPRMERPIRAPSLEQIPSRPNSALANPESQEWYDKYQLKAFPHDSQFGEQDYAKHNYDSHIHQIRDEQERVQKKTFVNWINSYLAKRIPPMKIEDLIDGLRDGTRLLALLEVLGGERLPTEKGRVLRRPHYLSNVNTALEYLRSKRIKLVNINAADVVDGRPAVVLGLIWTIILYFQIEENTRVLESLGQRYGSPAVGRSGYGTGESEDDRGTPGGVRKLSVPEKWKLGARKALLHWCQTQIGQKFGVGVTDFGKSWRDGNAFLAIINSIQPGAVDMTSMRQESNQTRLETAFYVAEVKLGVTRLLDPEDVDVPSPDEKSVMTYVAQFLHKYPEGAVAKGSDRFGSLDSQYQELRAWLTTKISWFEQMQVTKGQLPMNYDEFQKCKAEMKNKQEIYERLRQLKSNKQLGITPEAWHELDNNWQKVETQVRHWQWLLDTALPGEFGQIGEWLNQGEGLINSDDIPAMLNEEAAAVLNQKIEDHKAFFADLSAVQTQFETAVTNSPYVEQIPKDQLQSMAQRLRDIGPKADVRAVRLKFLEHKCCIVAFLMLTESKLKNWTIKYGREERVQQIMSQYKTFVSKNKIFQEFQKAFVEFQDVSAEYKKDGEIDTEESQSIDRFIDEVANRWKNTSTELRCVQSLLEEVLTYWKRWNGNYQPLQCYIIDAFEALKKNEDAQQEFFHDFANWKERYILLEDTVAFLVATSDAAVGQDLREKFMIVSNNWEQLFKQAEGFLVSGDISRKKRVYQEGLEQLDQWLRKAESVLNTTQQVESGSIKKTLEVLMELHSEVGGMEELFKSLSRKFQQLVPELDNDDIENMMFSLKKKKENLVIIRSMIPTRIQLFHHLLSQVEAFDMGERELLQWCDDVDSLVKTVQAVGEPEDLQIELAKHKPFLAKTVNMQSLLQSKRNVFQGVLKNTEGKEGLDASDVSRRMDYINGRFEVALRAVQQFETNMTSGMQLWDKFLDAQKAIVCWLKEAKNLFNMKNINSPQVVQQHRSHFAPGCEAILNNYLIMAQQLEPFLSESDKAKVREDTGSIKAEWDNVHQYAPHHALKTEFRLHEDKLNKSIKEIENKLQDESQAFQKSENIPQIIQEHTDYFNRTNIIQDARESLMKMAEIVKRYKSLAPEDRNLEDILNTKQNQWDLIYERIQAVLKRLEQIPEQWREYEKKFSQMVRWMDTVDNSLAKMFKGQADANTFEGEKQGFQELCRDVDNRRDDMKWLVQKLDSLVSQRADDAGLSEQKRLEGLITRYKSMIPVIEMTMQKVDIYSKSYHFQAEAHNVHNLLNDIQNKSIEDNFPATEEDVQALVNREEAILQQLDDHRGPVLSLLQKGLDLMRDPKAPPFLKEEVKALESMWNDCYSRCVERRKNFTEQLKVWHEYKENKVHMLRLIDDSEFELNKAVPQHDHKEVKLQLRVKKNLKEEIGKATEDILGKMRELADALSTAANPEQQSALSDEMNAMEQKLRDLLEECDEKIQHLGELDVKWTEFHKNLGELKDWVGKAKGKLNQITKLDVSPDDRVKMTLELQQDVKCKMKQLEKLETDAHNLFENVPHTATVNDLKIEVETVKKDVEALNMNVDAKSVAIAKDLDIWNACQNDLLNIKPWLEKAEMKVAMGLPRHTNLQDALNELTQLKRFEEEIFGKEKLLVQAADKGANLSCGQGISDDVDALKSRLQAVKANVTQWIPRLEDLVKTWKHFDNGYDEIDGWIEAKMTNMKGHDNLGDLSIDALTGELDQLKALNDNLTQKQVELLGLSKDCDIVAMNMSQDTAQVVKQKVGHLKGQLSDLSDSSRAKMSNIMENIQTMQEFQDDIGDVGSWLKDLNSRIVELNEVPFNHIDSSLENVHSLAQEHADNQSRIAKVEINAKNKILSNSIRAMQKKYLDLGDLLENKKKSLQRWSSFCTWHAESDSALNHLEQTLDNVTSLDGLEIALAELDSLAQQCQSKKNDGANDEEMAAKSKTYVIQNGKPTSVLLLVADILQRIVQLKDMIEAKEDKLHSLEDKWDNFKDVEQQLADWLQQVLQKVQKINVRESTIDCLKTAASAVAELDAQCDQKASLKDDYERLGRELVMSDPQQVSVVQDALSEATSKWDKVTSLLKEQQGKSQSLIALWEQCLANKDIVMTQLDEVHQAMEDLEHTPIRSKKDVAQMVDKCRKGLDTLKKVRHPFEVFYKKQTQLIQELQTVPNFDIAPLRTDMQEVQKKYSYLGKTLKGNLNGLESKMVLWAQWEQLVDDLSGWIQDTQDGFECAATNIADLETAKGKLSKYDNDLPSMMSQKANVAAKMALLVESNHRKPIEGLQATLEDMDQGFANVEGQYTTLKEAIEGLDKTADAIRAKIKAHFDDLATLREKAMTCEDFTGPDSEILERLLLINQLQGEADDFEESMGAIEGEIKDLSHKFQAADVAPLAKELSSLAKRYDVVSSQIAKTALALYNVLEKHYVEKVQSEIKSIASAKEKLLWCQPDQKGDKFSLETKMDALNELARKLELQQDPSSSLGHLADLLLQVADDDKGHEVKDTVKCLDRDKKEVMDEIAKLKIDISELLLSWRNVDLLSDKLADWLKNSETIFREEIACPTELETCKEISDKLEQLKTELHAQDQPLEELNQATDVLMAMSPDARVRQQTNKLKNRYEAFKVSVDTQLQRLQDLADNKGAQMDAINEYE